MYLPELTNLQDIFSTLRGNSFSKPNGRGGHMQAASDNKQGEYFVSVDLRNGQKFTNGCSHFWATPTPAILEAFSFKNGGAFEVTFWHDGTCLVVFRERWSPSFAASLKVSKVDAVKAFEWLNSLQPDNIIKKA